VRSSERERHRWARELHDETLQQLGAMKLMHEIALERRDPDVFRRTVERAMAQFDETIESLERLISELRPAALDELGPGAALEALADKLNSTSDLEVEIDVNLAFEDERETTRHTEELETTLYRVVQEALNNVVKHAGANTVTISVIENGDRIEVSVADDGSGLVDDRRHQRYGLRGIRERVDLIGGEVQIDSSPGEGTTIRASLPVSRRDAGA
jgi:signal transduction histidine kinase